MIRRSGCNLTNHIFKHLFHYAALLAFIFAVASISAQTAPAPFDITVKRLSPRIGVFYGDPWDNAIVAIATQKGIVVIDAPFSKTIAKGFRDAIQVEFKRNDFVHLVNTHDHVCHIGGNEAYADLPIVGHESLLREMLKLKNDPKRASNMRGIGERSLAGIREYLQKNDPQKLQGHGFANFERGWRIIQADYRDNPLLLPPTITFDREMTLHLGDVNVRLTYYGHAHGIADTIVSIPEENVILTAGIFEINSVPITGKVTEEATPAVLDNWFVVMHRLLNESNENTQFLPSHGRAAMKKDQIQQSVSYLEELWRKVRLAKASGKTLAEIKADIPLKNFPEIAKFPNEYLRGTEWEILDIHQQNIEHMWRALES
jgi:glyoxylase-like metal-dependent hydrolase (beta-lactamase superfamily II)